MLVSIRWVLLGEGHSSEKVWSFKQVYLVGVKGCPLSVGTYYT